MFFPCDPYQNNLPDLLSAAVRDFKSAHDGARLYALVDGALNTKWGSQFLSATQTGDRRVKSLYDGTDLQDMQECSPFLCQLEVDQIETALHQAAGAPLISFLQSDLDIDALSKHFSPFLLVGTGDALWFPIRWAYPLAVPKMLKILGTEVAQSVTSGFRAWHLITREGGLQTVAGSDSAPIALDGSRSKTNRLVIGDDSFAALVAAGEADMLLIAAHGNSPELVRGKKLSDVYQLASSALVEMSKQRIDAAPERDALMMEILAANGPINLRDHVRHYAVQRSKSSAVQ